MTTKQAVDELFEIMHKKGLTVRYLSIKLNKPEMYFYHLKRRKKFPLEELKEFASVLDVEIHIEIKEK
jgi:hypothetical protein